MTSLLIVSRFFHWGATLLLVGIVAFRWLVLRPGFSCAGEADGEIYRLFSRRLEALFIGALTVLVLSGVGLFWAVTAGMSGSSLDEALRVAIWATVLGQTKFGAIFLGRAVLAGLLIILSTAWPQRHRNSWLEISRAVIVIALLLSLAWTGHAAAVGGSLGAWRTGADALHLFTAAIWPTGLLFFALFLRDAGSASFSIVCFVVRRFSNLSLAAVLVLAASGVLNAWFLVGSWAALLGTPYGEVLCFKLALFLLMLAMAAWNRFRLLPVLFEAEESGLASVLLGPLRRFVWIEVGLAVAVMAVVAFLGVMPPPS